MLLRIAFFAILTAGFGTAQVTITPSTGREVTPTAGTQWSLTGSSLKRAIAEIYDVTPSRVSMPATLDDGKVYDFQVVAPSFDHGHMRELLQQGIEKQFGVSISHEQRLMDVYVLTAPNGLGKLVSSSAGRGRQSSVRLVNSDLRGSGFDIKLLTDVLESPLALGRPVIDETHLTGTYDMEITLRHGPDSLIRSLDESGLVVVPDRRMVDIVVVR